MITRIRGFYQAAVNIIERYYWVFFAGTAAILAFLCFYHLDVAYVSSWDEARHGVSAYEMIQNKNYIVNTFAYENDYWNLKPPLSFYGIILGFRLFGYSVLGLRFYSACAYLLTCLAVGIFLKKHYNGMTSLVGLCFLACNYLTLGFHCARAGDADSLYLFFFTVAMLAMLEIPEKHGRLYVCGFCFACAFLTKSFHGGIIALIGGAYLILTGEIRKIKLREWICFFLSFFIPLGLWGLLRFSQDGTTFFVNMIQTDLLSRSSSASEGHAGSFWFYYDTYFKEFHYIYRSLLLITGGGLLWMVLDKFTGAGLFKEEKKRNVGLLLWLCLPFLFFSAVSTKLVWYGYPILIPLSMMAAITVGTFLSEKKMPVILKMAAGAVCLYLIAFHMHDTYAVAIGTVHGDGLQQFIMDSVDREDDIAGETAYIDAAQEMEDGTVWNQHVRFLAEISGDFRCEDGGTKGFLKAEQEQQDVVLYISRERYDEKKEMLSGRELQMETDEYLLVKSKIR